MSSPFADTAYDNDGVGNPLNTDCSVCGEWMKMSHRDVLACPICDMADERYDEQIGMEREPIIWPSIYMEYDDTWFDAWFAEHDDETDDGWIPS